MTDFRSITAKFNCQKQTQICSCHAMGGYLYVGSGPEGIVYRTKDGSDLSEFYKTGESYVTALSDFGNALFIGTSPSGYIFMHNFSTGNRFHYATSGDYQVTAFCVHSNKLYAGTSPSGLVLSFDGTTWAMEYDSYGGGINSMVSFGGSLYLFIEEIDFVPCLTSSGWQIMKNGDQSFSLSAFKKVTTSLSSLNKNRNFDYSFKCAVATSKKLYFCSGNRCNLYEFDGKTVKIIYQWSGRFINSIEIVGEKQLVVAVDDEVYVSDLE